MTARVSRTDPAHVAFLNDEGERRLSEAIEAVEARSRAELVVVVRPEVGDYLGNELIVGGVTGLAALGFTLYSSFEFALHWILLDPLIFAGLAITGLRLAPFLRAMIVGDARKRAAVQQAAESCFFRKGVRQTRERTGILIFVGMFEEQVVVLPDSGIAAFVPKPDWDEAVARLQAVFHDEGDASVLAARIEALGELLETWCPAREDDIDELSNDLDLGDDDDEGDAS